MSDEARCSQNGCPNEARMAIRTVRPSPAKLTTTVWWDDRTAPKTAMRYCRQHGAALLSGFVPVLVESDRAA